MWIICKIYIRIVPEISTYLVATSSVQRFYSIQYSFMFFLFTWKSGICPFCVAFHIRSVLPFRLEKVNWSTDYANDIESYSLWEGRLYPGGTTIWGGVELLSSQNNRTQFEMMSWKFLLNQDVIPRPKTKLAKTCHNLPK